MSQQIETYTLKQIQDFAKEYKFCSLTDVNGHQKMNWNGYSTPMKEHFPKCLKRLDSVALPKGYYYFCFSNSMKKTGDPDRFLVCKGDPSDKSIIIHPNGNNLQNNFQIENALTMEQALKYITEISELKVSNSILERENKELKDRNEVLEGWFASEEDEDGLNDDDKKNSTGENILTYLKDSKPEFVALFDRFFEDKEKTRQLEYAKLNGGKKADEQKRIIKKFEVGSEAHLKLIRAFYKSGDDDKLNKELDKLEGEKPEIYSEICKESNITDDGE